MNENVCVCVRVCLHEKLKKKKKYGAHNRFKWARNTICVFRVLITYVYNHFYTHTDRRAGGQASKHMQRVLEKSSTTSTQHYNCDSVEFLLILIMCNFSFPSQILMRFFFSLYQTLLAMCACVRANVIILFCFCNFFLLNVILCL